MDRASVKARVGALIKRKIEAVDGQSGYLINNFSVSVIEGLHSIQRCLVFCIFVCSQEIFAPLR